MNRLIILVLLMFLSGCTKEERKIQFIEGIKISVDTPFNTSSLVKSVNGKEITKFDLDGERILIGDDVILCPSLDTSVPGIKTLIFEYRKQKYDVDVEVIDDIPPFISYKGDSITVPLGTTKEMLLESLGIDDKHSAVVATIAGDYNPDQSGQYSVIVRIDDESGNDLEKLLKVIVEDSKESEKVKASIPHISNEKEEPKKSVEKKSTAPKQQSEDDKSSSKPNSDIYNPVAKNKQFLFSQGYDYETCYQAAMNFAEDMVSQNKARGYTCNPIRDSSKEYIGYEVIFK